ncbi:substrate-binding periplasmic protein [Litoribrevibacter euphylliae]|uniref:Substrate-binding periplasmic protein n=1 Tax=Litoribrevibacter euphylliae TaxID=1834034 RepID=A0ABV7HL69_9GAMM
MKSMVSACLALMLSSGAALAEQTVTFTYENVDSYPWSMKDGSGVNFILLEMTDEALPEVAFKYIQAPWQRCLHNIENGITEGCFAASFKEKRLQHGLYPATHSGGDVDPGMRLHSSSYSLYVKKDSNVNVTGKMTISGLTGKVAAPAGYSIGDDLAKAGYQVDAKSSKTLNNFQKLLSGRVDAVAALTLNGDNILASDSKFSGQLKAIETPLVDKPYYLMLSKQFVNSNKALAEKIWMKAAEIRETKAFKDKAGEFLAK